MTDADRLRAVLPRLHAAGIASDLYIEIQCGSFFLVRDGPLFSNLTDAHAITYAIGAMVEAMFNAMLPIRPTVVRSDSPSLLEQLIKDAEMYGLISKEPA